MLMVYIFLLMESSQSLILFVCENVFIFFMVQFDQISPNLTCLRSLIKLIQHQPQKFLAQVEARSIHSN